MEDNSIYVKILLDTLEKKAKVIKDTLELTKRQEKLLSAQTFDFDSFEITLEEKDKLIKRINDLDEGFTLVYNKVSEELQIRRAKYKEQIEKMQEYIIYLTENSVKIQSLEQKNKLSMEIILRNRKSEIKQKRASNKTVTSYYKAMSNNVNESSQYVDKKN